jgi:hypothetical protein
MNSSQAEHQSRISAPYASTRVEGSPGLLSEASRVARHPRTAIEVRRPRLLGEILDPNPMRRELGDATGRAATRG